MKRLFAVAVIFTSLGLLLGFYLRGGSSTALAGSGGGGVPTCSSKNGDVNGDGNLDLSDAVTILNFLFIGSPTELLPLCSPPPALGGLPDTGQTTCHRVSGEEFDCGGFFPLACPFQGQDGRYDTGCPNDANRFTVNEDDTVTDNCTGLQWQRFTADRNGDGRTSIEDRSNWCGALDFCEALNFAGHEDWRLPNVRELQSIVDYGEFNPAADPIFRAESATYWTSTSVLSTPDVAWGVFFDSGELVMPNKNVANTHFARAVRNAP